MSFFGFDTTLPGDPRASSSSQYKNKSNNSRFNPSSDDPFNPVGYGNNDDDTFGDLGEDELEAKIRGLTAGAQEDVQIYEWGGEGYDGLGDKLEEAGDDLNDDTFGMGAGDVGKDFDFGHGPSAGAAGPQQQQRQQKPPVDSMFASNFDDFWALPSFNNKPPQQQQQQQQQQPAPPQVARVGKTMEEIEAELRGSSISTQPQVQHQTPQQQQQQQQQPAAAGRRPLTMEEIEAEIRAQQQHVQRQQQHQGIPSAPPAPTGGNFPPPGMPPNLASMMQGAPTQQPDVAGADFPPLGAGPAPPRAGTPSRSGPAGSMPLPAPPAMPPIAAMHPQQQAEHFARMQAMLRALPQRVQDSLTSLPPHMHFDVLQGVCREFPILLEPPSAAIEERQTMAEEAALGRFRMIGHFDKKRAIREAKIASMARSNNLMTVSDKEFITRIQISQIISADPYADDFYAHIYFALRGRPGPNPGLMGAPPMQQQQQQPQQQHPSKSKGRQNKMNAQQKAMLRMQQQVERLVADRKTRIEKAAAGANPNLAGALGKVGMNLAGNPRQALQINRGGDAGSQAPSAGGTAADAVRQALEGASLGGSAAAGGAANGAQGDADERRPPLTRHETLRILERLYDLVMNLEQLRRTAGASAEDGATPEQLEEQKELAAALWKELRVLEPLEVSDPHPFVSLLSTLKGKRLLPRALRHLSSEQTLTALTMIVASFDSLDVVREAYYLDDVTTLIPGAAAPDAPHVAEKKREVEAQAECFSNSIVPGMLGLMATSPMRIVIGMLALFVERNDIVKVVRSRAGIAFLTILLSRAESLRQGSAGKGGDAITDEGGATAAAAPTAEEQTQWSSIFQLLFERLVTGSGGLNNLFPSTRAKSKLPFGIAQYLSAHYSGGAVLQSTLDEADKEVWNLYAALAVSSTMEQQSILVQELREKILENVLEARGKKDSLEGQRKLRLVNIFLNALNLDASQITV